MKAIKALGLFLLTVFTVMGSIQAEEIIITPQSGDSFVLDVDKEAHFFDVVEELQLYLEEKEDTSSLQFGYLGMPVFAVSKAVKKGGRSYAAGASSSDKKEIRYIITSLAKYNWAQLAKEEKSLKKAGDRIAHVHPFRFLQTIFTDEELKASIYVVRNKSLVWKDYFNGLKKSMNEEFDTNLIQFTADFANNLGVSFDVILPLVQNRQWEVLVDTLINSIPRQGNPGRYDI